jgi:hypothetical protein
MANVVRPRMRSQASHQHVVLHALAKFLSLKGTPWSDRNL